jgi:TPR repeat protein
MSAEERKFAAARLTEERVWLPQRAEQGLAGEAIASHSVAMHLMFESAFLGEDAARDQEVFRWFYQAAVQGHPDAFMFLAHRYARGLGVARDDVAAARWFRRAASNDNAISMTAKGLLHAAGRGVRQDWGAAFDWWQRARARQPLASRFAGDAYACGLGVEQNHERAVSAYKAAAEKGEVTSSIQLGHMYANGCAEGGPESALKMFERAADDGHPEAQIALSDMLRRGRGSDPNAYRAYFWASLAERRLPPGELKTLAARRAKEAAGLLSSFLIADADKMVDSMIASSLEGLR